MVISDYIVVISFEVGVTLDIDFEDEVSRGSSSFTLTAPALYSEVLSIADPLGYLDTFLDGLVADTCPLADSTGSLDSDPLSLALVTGHLNSHRPLPIVDGPSSSTTPTLLRNCPRSAFASFAGTTNPSLLELDFLVHSRHTFHKTYLQVYHDVCSPGVP